jgi:hypothetical protein
MISWSRATRGRELLLARANDSSRGVKVGRVRKLRAVGDHLARLQGRNEKNGVRDARSGGRLGESVTCAVKQ